MNRRDFFAAGTVGAVMVAAVPQLKLAMADNPSELTIDLELAKLKGEVEGIEARISQLNTQKLLLNAGHIKVDDIEKAIKILEPHETIVGGVTRDTVLDAFKLHMDATFGVVSSAIRFDIMKWNRDKRGCDRDIESNLPYRIFIMFGIPIFEQEAIESNTFVLCNPETGKYVRVDFW